MRCYVIALLILLLAAGCRKRNADLPPYEFTFTNHTPRPVTVDVYTSREAYFAAVSPHLRQLVSPNQSVIIAGDVLQEGVTYYFDWYSDDYRYGNWLNDDFNKTGSPYVTFTPTRDDSRYFMNATSVCEARRIFLKDGNQPTRWLAVDAFYFSSANGYNSVWAQLTPAERHHDVTINRRFEAIMQPLAGPAETTLIIVHQLNQAYIEFATPTGVTTGNMLSGKLPTAPPPDYSSTATDTVMAQFAGSNYYFMMVKQ